VSPSNCLALPCFALRRVVSHGAVARVAVEAHLVAGPWTLALDTGPVGRWSLGTRRSALDAGVGSRLAQPCGIYESPRIVVNAPTSAPEESRARTRTSWGLSADEFAPRMT
jgi:hypothetical protein